MGFFIQDLHNHIVQLHAQQFAGQSTLNSFTVYRGQGLSKNDYDQLVKTKGGLLSFNNFLSTSTRHQISLSFVRKTMQSSNLVGILFVVKIDPSITSISFANVRDVSYLKGEYELLFSMHSIFRIGQMQQIDENDRLWQVDLTLTSDNYPDLHALTEHMGKETYPQLKEWDHLGNLLITLEQYEKAQEVCNILLHQTMTDREKSLVYNMLGQVKAGQVEYGDGIAFFEQSIEIQHRIHQGGKQRTFGFEVT
ncbi:unnamed protein product [Rotaria sp. Silwood2]|nr:unnamed protein product [Rotaria sp. Silwood2]CAF4300592.1 unnamed protein product [Rotaria sp. Silwood2]